MNRKFSVITTAGLALALACTLPSVAEASTMSAFGPGAVQTVAAASATQAALDPAVAPTVEDLGAGPDNSFGQRTLRISGQAVEGSTFVIIANGTETRRAVPQSGTDIALVTKGLRPGTNVIQVRQEFDAVTTGLGEVTYKIGQDVPTEEFDASKAPTVQGWEVFNIQRRAVLSAHAQDVLGSKVEAEIDGKVVSSPVFVGGGAVLTLDGLTPGENQVRFRQVSGADATAWTDVTALVLATPSTGKVVHTGNNVVIQANTDERGELVLRNDAGEELDRVTSTPARARTASLTANVGLRDTTLYVTVERDGFASDRRAVAVPEAGAGDQGEDKPFAVTSDDLYESGMSKTLTGTGKAGTEVIVTVPGASILDSTVVGIDGTWSFTIPLLTSGTYGGYVVQTGGGGRVDFQLNVNEHANPEVSIQNRADDSVQLAVYTHKAGTIEVYDGTELLGSAKHTGSIYANSIVVPVGAAATNLTVVNKFADDSESDRVDVPVRAAAIAAGEYHPVTVESKLTGRYNERLELSGKGEPGAEVRIQIPGKPLDTTVDVAADGTWEYTTPSVLQGAYYDNMITQTADNGTNTFRFDLESELVLEDPKADSTVDQKRPTFSGEGTDGATVTVSDEKARSMASTTVSGGAWSVQAPADLADGRHTFTVSQESKSGNTSSTEVSFTVAADEDGEDTPFVVSTPTSNSTVTTPMAGTPGFPNAKVTFTGTGTPNATITVKRANGKTAGTTTVNDTGEWSLDGDFGFATYPTTTVTQTIQGQTPDVHTIRNLTIKQEETATGLTVTSPQANATTGAPAGTTPGFPNAKLTVTGTGTTGDTVRLLRPNGKTAGTGTITDGTYTFDADVNWGTWNLTVQALRDGTVVETKALPAVTITPTTGNGDGDNGDGDTQTPFTVTTPTSNTTITTPKVGTTAYPNAKVTFTGTGTPNATITVLRSNGKTAGTTTVNNQGEWTLDGDLGFTKYPTTTVKHTLNGTTHTTTITNLTITQQ